ncbi:MAG TPA: TonB-dependent receptor, partial [candidate division Zixibacteria bacterium]|nr:TonB-dependent receptor [candidate division Zixibacteria bacterium]
MKSFTATAARAAVATTLAFAAAANATERDSLTTYFFPGVVVVANGVETPLNEVGGSVTVVSAEQLRSSQKTALLDVLRDTPGVDVTRTGGPGGQTSVFLRGANSEHTLILVDGVEMNDPSNPSGAFDFATLGVDNVERVEILRGSQSVLYGSDAIGGVINIVTREGRGTPVITASAEGGAYGTFREELALRGADRRGSYALSVSRTDADGISATESLPENEADGSAVSSFSGKLRLNLAEHAAVSLVARGSRSRTALDKSYSSYQNPGSFDDPNYDSDARQVFVKSELDATPAPDRLRTIVSAEFSAHRRRITDSDDATFGAGASDNQYDGEKFRAQARLIGEITDWNKLSAGVETERELMDQRAYTEISGARARTTGLYLLDQISVARRVYLTTGLRHDDHEFFGAHTTYRLTASVQANDRGTRLKGS